MKNIIKLSLVAIGMVSATIVSSSKLSAKLPPDQVAGYCNPTTDTVCGVTDGGFTPKGFFVTN